MLSVTFLYHTWLFKIDPLEDCDLAQCNFCGILTFSCDCAISVDSGGEQFSRNSGYFCQF